MKISIGGTLKKELIESLDGMSKAIDSLERKTDEFK